MKKIVYLIMAFFLLSSFTSLAQGVQVPYEGLNLKWHYNYEQDCGDQEQYNSENSYDILYQYKDMLPGDVIRVKKLRPNETFMKYNIQTREILEGSSAGNKTSHWIDTDVKIGDEISISGKDYNVVSLSEKIDIGMKEKVESIKVQNDLSQKDVTKSGGSISSGTQAMWFHKDSGIKLRYKLDSTFSYTILDSTLSCDINMNQELKSTGEDTDGDGIEDYDELLLHGTDPKSAYTDDDTLNDSKELEIGTDPLKKDTDGDNLSDGEEVNKYSSNPKKIDTDGDGLNDAVEVSFGSDPNKTDTDSDGLDDKVEKREGTDPRSEDTDSDGLNDKREIKELETNPTSKDTDNDGLEDGEEVSKGTKPKVVDTDSDSILDGEEVDMGLNPLAKDTDGDMLEDNVDPMPKSMFLPFALLILAIIALVLVFYYTG